MFPGIQQGRRDFVPCPVHSAEEQRLVTVLPTLPLLLYTCIPTLTLHTRLTPHTPHSLSTLLHFPSSHVTSHSTPTLPCALHTSLASMILCLQVSHNDVSCYLHTPHTTPTPHSPHITPHTLVGPLYTHTSLPHLTPTPHSPHLTPHTLAGPLYTHSSLPHLSLSHCRVFF